MERVLSGAFEAEPIVAIARVRVPDVRVARERVERRRASGVIRRCALRRPVI